MSKPNMRRFVARSIVNTVEFANAAYLMLVLALLVLIPVGFLIAAYLHPVPRVVVLMMATTASILYLLAGCCQHVYEWAKRSA